MFVVPSWIGYLVYWRLGSNITNVYPTIMGWLCDVLESGIEHIQCLSHHCRVGSGVYWEVGSVIANVCRAIVDWLYDIVNVCHIIA